MNKFQQYDGEVFSSTMAGNTALITFKQDAFTIAMNPQYLKQVIDGFNEIEMDESIHGVLTIDRSMFDSITSVSEFIESLQKKSGSVVKERLLSRFNNASKQLTLLINSFSKPNVVAIQGKRPMASFGYYLACDYVIAADNIEVECTSLQLGVSPIGAAPFYLMKEIGQRKTLDLFLSCPILDADYLQSYNIVDEVVALDELEETGLDKLEQYYRIPRSAFSTTKRLMKAANAELEDFFEHSTQQLWRSISST